MRPLSEILQDIESFHPDEDWGGLDTLLQELFQHDSESIPPEPLLTIFERYPNHDGYGVFWGIVHGLETVPAYEQALFRSLERVPSNFALIMVQRRLNSASLANEAPRWYALLESIGTRPLDDDIRETLTDILTAVPRQTNERRPITRPNALVIEYDDFPPVPKEEWQGSELKQAVMLARVIAGDLRSQGAFTPEEPVEEDYGAVLGVLGQTGTTEIFISFYPRDKNDFTWALQFRQRAPFLRGLFSKGDDESVIGPVKEALASLVASRPGQYKNAEWIDPSGLG